jgi:hypothetical protein
VEQSLIAEPVDRGVEGRQVLERETVLELERVDEFDGRLEADRMSMVGGVGGRWVRHGITTVRDLTGYAQAGTLTE